MHEIIVNKIRESDVDVDFVNQLKVAFPVEDTNPIWELENIRSLVQNPKNIFLIGYLNGYMAGFVYGYMLDRPDNKKDFLIYEVSTSIKYRRKGVMKAIIHSLLSTLKKLDFDEAWVLTNKSNVPATSLYEKTGGVVENECDIMFVYKLK